MLNCYICQAPHVSWRSVSDYVLLVDHKRGQLLTLNEVARTIWEMADTWTHVEQIIEKVKKIYDVDNATARQDVEDFIEYLLQEQVLVISDDYLKRSKSPAPIARDFFNESLPQDLKAFCIRNTIPLVGCLEITEHCNLQCLHCYNSPQKLKELSFNEIVMVLDNLAHLGCLELLITGGEPTIRSDFSEILWYARRKKFSVTLKTNATRLDGSIAELLKKAFVTEVHVSVYSLVAEDHDAITGVSGSLECTLQGIKNLTGLGVRVQIACPLTKISFRSIRRLKQWADTIGVPCAFDPVITTKVNGDRSPLSLRLDEADIEELYRNGIYTQVIFPHLTNTSDASPSGIASFAEEQKGLPLCGAGSSMVFISAYGDVFPCVALPMKAGNVRETPLEELWRTSPVLQKVRALSSEEFKVCKGCENLANCVRCPGIFYSDTGSPVMPSKAICVVASYSERANKGGKLIS